MRCLTCESLVSRSRPLTVGSSREGICTLIRMQLLLAILFTGRNQNNLLGRLSGVQRVSVVYEC